ncbi:MAG: hypothetical protein GY805_29625 [Chloroflexi bacterium]|nr:hypothetical protein [Chloroflexota bacterium]
MIELYSIIRYDPFFASLPQTITIEQFTNGWYITDILFYEAPAFCQ